MTEKKKPGVIRRIFRGLMAVISGLRLFVINMVFLLIIAMLFFALSGGQLPTIPEKGALIVNLEGRLVDQKRYADPVALLFGESDPQQGEVLLQDVIKAVDYAAADERITSLVLVLDNFVYGGISKTQELSSALQRFRASGKKIIAVNDTYSQDQYLLAAQSDEVYIHPMGGVMLTGYGLYRNYFKDALDKLEVTFNVFRVGEFKSALEPVMRNSMSEEARAANRQWLTSLWSEYTVAVAGRRGLQPADINAYINEIDKVLQQHGGDTAQAALATGLVDGIKTRDEMNNYLAEVAGAVNKEGQYEGTSFQRYLWLQKMDLPTAEGSEKVGVIVAAGNIMSGEQPAGTIGGDTLAELVHRAAGDDGIKALVVRVDSGGGSAFASEIIRREIELYRQTGKPLVVSMGSMAASGGYWISADADEIWATPTTLTGSIGIYGAFPTVERSLAKLGISTDGIGTTKLAGALRMDRPLDPMAQRSIQYSLEHGYGQFINIVASGRNIPRSEVEQIAQGRVWAGVDALRIGLVDHLGGLDQAIASAAALAELENYEAELIEPQLSPQEQLLKEIAGGAVSMGWLLPKVRMGLFEQFSVWLTPLTSSVEWLSTMNDPKGLYVHCPDCIAP